MRGYYNGLINIYLSLGIFECVFMNCIKLESLGSING